MKRLRIALSSFALILAGTSPAKADWDYWAIKSFGPKDTRGLGIYTVNSTTGSSTLRTTFCNPTIGASVCANIIGPETGIDPKTGLFVLEDADENLQKYDLNTNQWTNAGTSWTSGYSAAYSKPGVVGGENGAINVGIGEQVIFSRKSNGEMHIGENSFITKEEDGVQKIYAKDANGNAIPLNVTEGSDLQINGASVQGQINTNKTEIKSNSEGIKANKRSIQSIENNVNDLGFGVAGATALSTAMSALPTVTQDSPLSCGIGTGGYSSRFAMSVGCAFKASDRLSINAGGSYVFGGAADYGNGSLSTAAARAGFVFKLGNIDAPLASSEKLQSQLNDVKEENASIREENAAIQAQNQELLARLERLEAIALGEKPVSKSVSLK